MSYLTEVNCSTILEAIITEKKLQKERDDGKNIKNCFIKSNSNLFLFYFKQTIIFCFKR